MSYNFLILDDSAAVRAMIKRAVLRAELSGGKIFDASTGAEAMEVLAVERVDLVLADVNTAAMDGIEMIARILSEPATRHVPVVVMARAPDVAQVRRLRRAGARAWLHKPFTAESLHEVIAHVLEPTHV